MREPSRKDGVRACAPATAVPAVLAVIAMMAGAVARPVHAQTVQKCVRSDGHVTLTSDSCGSGHRLVASYDAVPEAVPASAPAVEAPASRASPVPSATRAVARAGNRGSYRSRPRSAADPCRSARERRERTLQKAGLKRNFDLLRRLDDEVWAACR